MSPNGRIGAMTTFVSGDSYTSPGAVLDPHDAHRPRAAAATIADLEKFTVTKDGERIHSPGLQLLGRDVRARQRRVLRDAGHGRRTTTSCTAASARAPMEVIHDNVECPSLSPDGTRIAYKRRDGKPWHLAPARPRPRTGADAAVAERRPIDDQAEWLDNRAPALRHRRRRVDRPGRRQRPPAAVPGRRGLAVHPALRTSSMFTREQRVLPTVG